jgi:hypothetical protein
MRECQLVARRALWHQLSDRACGITDLGECQRLGHRQMAIRQHGSRVFPTPPLSCPFLDFILASIHRSQV